MAMLGAMSGSLVAFLSVCPWAHRPGAPFEAVFAGHVSGDRRWVLASELLAATAAAFAWKRRVKWPMTVALAAFLGVVFVAIGAISTVSRAVEARVGEPESQVGLALYLLLVIAVCGVGVSVHSLRSSGPSR
jgi:hypothetical protein